MANFVVVLILAVVVGAAVRYIYKSKKSGAKCIGCPSSGSCCRACHCNDGSCSGGN